MKIYKGIACSGGAATGRAYKHSKTRPEVDRRTLLPGEAEKEIIRLEEAVECAKVQISGIRSHAYETLGKDNSEVFNAHLAILGDPELITELKDAVISYNITASAAIESVFGKHIKMFEGMDDEYFRERAADIDDIGQRLLRNISGITPDYGKSVNGSYIFVADEITPTDMAMIIRESLLGIVSGKGSNTAHAAIMARSLGIPAVFGLGEAISFIGNDESIIIDGTNGYVIASPDVEQIEAYKGIAETYAANAARDDVLAFLPSVTLDGEHITLLANIDTPEDISVIEKYGAEGVGLYRSEFLYTAYNGLPGEKEQFEAYKTAALRLRGKPLAIRTLDAGGDKSIPGLNPSNEINPFLGWRSIRISLDRRDIFKAQLKSVLKAGIYGSVSLMYPMVSNLSEIREANKVLEEAKSELEREGYPFDRRIKTGLMVEVPAAAIMIDVLVKEVDFVSIGTNDLCQYVLAADRSNPKVSHLHQPLHPAILRLISNVIKAAAKQGIPVSICGEMASDPASVLILLGLGMVEFSMNAASLPTIKKVVRSVSLKQAKSIAEHALSLPTPDEVVSYSKDALKSLGL